MPNDEPLSDEMVAAHILEGDTDSYGVLMQRYEAKLKRYTSYILRDAATADDVVQITFIKAYQNLRSFNPAYKFSSWIYRIAHNESMNVLKKNRHMSDDAIEDMADQSYAPGVEQHIDDAILQADVQGCLSELEQKYRDVVQLIYFEGMKYEDASDVLHIPTSTVGVWLSRAKAKLLHICQKKGVRR